MSDDLLNSYQRNSVANTLRTLEMALRRALSDLASQDQGILYRRHGVLPDEQVAHVRRAVDSGLHEIDALAQALALPVEAYDNRAALLGQLSVLWVDLHEIRAESLRGYGAVNPDLPAVLNARIERLIELVAALMNILQAQNERE